MCYICDGGTEEEIQELIGFDIQFHGFHLQVVTGDRRRSNWAYTVGLLERFGHPELIVTGRACAHCLGLMLTDVGDRVSLGEHYVVGDETLSEGGAELRFGAVHPRQWSTDRFAVWHRHYARRPWPEPEPRALQLLWRNDEGIWQDSAGNPWWRRDRLDRPPSPAGRSGRYVR
jgi:hypothetical protein